MDRQSDHSENQHETIEQGSSWVELLAGYALGDLSPEDEIALKQYLDSNPSAIVQVEELRQTLALLPLALPNVTPPIDLKDKLLASAIAEEYAAVPVPQFSSAIGISQTSRNRHSLPRIPQWTPGQVPGWAIVGTIAAGMIAVLGVPVYQLQREFEAMRQEIAQFRQSQENLTAQQTHQSRYQEAIAMITQTQGRMLNLTGLGSATDASGSVVIAPSQKRAMLLLQHMPPPPEGTVYHLWAMVEGRKVACIQFTPEADGEVVMQLPAERWTNAVGVAITIEPMETESQPTGEMIMESAEI